MDATAVLSHETALIVARGTAEGGFDGLQSLSRRGTSRWSAAGDFRGSGLLDVAVNCGWKAGGPTGEVWNMEPDGQFAFAGELRSSISDAGDACGFAAADVDGDGRDDLFEVCERGYTSIRRGGPSGLGEVG